MRTRYVKNLRTYDSARADHPDYLPVGVGDADCESESWRTSVGQRFFCTRPFGHPGDHAAHIDTRMIARWPNTADPDPERSIEGPVDRPADTVIKASPHGYFVKSRTRPGVWWFTTADACSCPATVDVCHHRRVVFAWGRANAPKRPTPAAAPAGMFVD